MNCDSFHLLHIDFLISRSISQTLYSLYKSSKTDNVCRR